MIEYSRRPSEGRRRPYPPQRMATPGVFAAPVTCDCAARLERHELLIGLLQREVGRLDQALRLRRNAPLERRCWRCKSHKPIEEFGLDSSRTDGHSHICRPCNRERERARKR
jgi:hypothetical protein